jgi:hypothetical protein
MRLVEAGLAKLPLRSDKDAVTSKLLETTLDPVVMLRGKLGVLGRLVLEPRLSGLRARGDRLSTTDSSPMLGPSRLVVVVVVGLLSRRRLSNSSGSLANG